MVADVTSLERAVMGALLAGDDDTLAILSHQLADATVESRELTGVGFFTNFATERSCPRVPGRQSFSFGDVHADIEGLAYGAGFMLHVRDGRIDYLEGYSFDEPWPKEVKSFRLSYTSGKGRDFDELRRKWT